MANELALRQVPNWVYGGEPPVVSPTPGYTPQPPASPAAPKPGLGRRLADATADAGAKTRGAMNAAGSAAEDLGSAARRALPTAKSLLRGAAGGAGVALEVAPHIGFYGSDAPLGDKLRVGVTDALATAGGVGGALLGGAFGTGFAPGPGTLIGAAGGGGVGAAGGHALGNTMTGSDDILKRYDAAKRSTAAPAAPVTPATPATPAAPPQHGLRMPLPEGVRPSLGRDIGPLGRPQRADDLGTGQTLSNYLAGGGNGQPFDPLSGAGGGRDRRLPTDLSSLQQGQVYKTIDPKTGRIVYSGRDVKEGAAIRDANGTATGQLRSPDFISDDGGREARRQDALELNRLVAERAEREAGYAANQPGGGLGGIQGKPLGLRLANDGGGSGAADALARSPRAADRRAAAELAEKLEDRMISEQGQNSRNAAANSTALRTNAATNEVSRENNAATNRTAAEGHRLELESRMIPLQVAQARRKAVAAAYAGGKDGAALDHITASRRLAAAGWDEDATKLADLNAKETADRGARDKQDIERQEATHAQLRPYFQKDDGKGGTTFDELGARKAQATIRQLYPGYDGLPAAAKRAVEQEIIAKQRNMAAETRPAKGWIDSAADLIGLYEQPPAATAPVDLRGGDVSRAGLFAPPGVSRHATKVVTKDGKTYYYGAGGEGITDEQAHDIKTRTQLRQ